MKCLSLKQPWAWLMFHGKPVENRTWRTNYRGPLLIHASLTYDVAGDLWIRSNFPEVDISLPSARARGAIIGRVDMVDCVTLHPSPWFFGPYGFIFENPVEFKNPILWKGKLNLFEVPGEVLDDRN